MPIGADDDGIGGQIAMDHHMVMGVLQSAQYIAHDAYLLIEGQGQRGLFDVHAQGIAVSIFGDEHKVIALLAVEEVMDIEDVGVTGNIADSAKSVANHLLLAFARLLILIGIGAIDAQAHAAAFAGEDVMGAILCVALVATQLLFYLPVAIDQGRGSGLRLAQDGMLDQGQQVADIAGHVCRYIGRVLKVGQAFLQAYDIGAIAAIVINNIDIGRGQEDGGAHINPLHFGSRAIVRSEHTFKNPGIQARLAQGRTVRLAPLGIPLGAKDLNQAAHAFDIDDIDTMGSEYREIDL